MCNWINVNAGLPTISKNVAGVICDIWVVCNETKKGSRVADACYEYTTSDEPEFHGNGCDIREFTVTHWMHPQPPLNKS